MILLLILFKNMLLSIQYSSFNNVSSVNRKQMYTVFAIEEHLGRPDFASLSQQTLMELLVEDIESSSQLFHGRDGSFRDVAEWSGITCEDGTVTEIRWWSVQAPFFPGNGHISLKWIPSSVTHFLILFNDFTGTLQAHELPIRLHTINLSYNQLEGSIKTHDLPRALVDAYFISNRFSGTLDLQSLPTHMENFDVCCNSFKGSVNLANLPQTLQTLPLGSNEFHGTIDLTRVPPSIIAINLSGNYFRQDVIRIGPLSKNLKSINLCGVKYKKILDTAGHDLNGEVGSRIFA